MSIRVIDWGKRRRRATVKVGKTTYAVIPTDPKATPDDNPFLVTRRGDAAKHST